MGKTEPAQPQIVKCSMCGRDWPRETSAPEPGSVVGPNAPTSHIGVAGYWRREELGLTDGVLQLGEWKYIGPCCDTFWSGWDGLDDDDYEDDEWEEEDYSDPMDDDEWEDWLND